MNRRKLENQSGKFLLLVLALGISLCPLPGAATEFVLLFSNDNHGEIEPCG
ncbi:MAG: hypothetical protein ACYCYR_01245 [Desulfobulbaceae bacterium]